ncbi:MAG: hypothetical protein OTJ97_09515, partial [SAR202 cluster bacterium]|nr:hypothetical protein [SAR202 cluster bacterium]
GGCHGVDERRDLSVALRLLLWRGRRLLRQAEEQAAAAVEHGGGDAAEDQQRAEQHQRRDRGRRRPVALIARRAGRRPLEREAIAALGAERRRVPVGADLIGAVSALTLIG